MSDLTEYSQTNGGPSTPLDIAALVSHPIQYQAPLFREIAARDNVSLTVYFCSKRGVEEQVDQGFGTEITWDVPLLEGYDHSFLRNWSPLNTTSVGLFNPGVVRTLARSGHDALWVHGYAPITNWLAFSTARLVDLPIVLRGESTPLDEGSGIGSWGKHLLLTQLFDSVSAFAAIGSLNRSFYRNFGIPEEKLFHAPYTVDNSFFRETAQSLPPAATLKEEEGIDPDTPVALFVGKLIERKRPSLLLEAFDRATNPGEATLLFVGDGPARERLESAIDARGCASDVRLAGFKNQTELPRYYKLSDAFVLPSGAENWGLVVNEAMNFALPVVVSDAVGAGYDLVDEQNGHVVPTDDVASLADALADLFDSEASREARGAVSAERIRDWDIESTADGIVAATDYARSTD